MSWIHKYESRSKTTVCWARGILTDDDMVEGITKAVEDPNYRPEMRFFVDYSRVDEFQVTASAFARLEKLDASHHTTGRMAFLVFHPQGSSNFRALTSRQLSERYHEFASRAAAVAWLNEGVPPAESLSVEDTLPIDSFKFP